MSFLRNSVIAVLTVCALFFCSNSVARADEVVFESATIGSAQTGGLSIYSMAFIGASFQLTSRTQITQIGGNLRGSGNVTLFGAIVSLASLTSLPATNLSGFLATTLLNPPPSTGDPSTGFGAMDTLGAVSLTLDPGFYGVVIGAGLFGSPASDQGGLSGGNNLIPGTNYFACLGSPAICQVQPAADSPVTRLIVRGNVAGTVPEPATMLLLGSGLAGLGATARRRQKKEE